MGHVGERAGDWALAIERWREFRLVFPHDPIVWEHYGRAHQESEFARLASSGEESEAAPVDQARIDVVKDEDRRTLLLGFESLGSDCQFGMVQRRYGAEPLGLLRFNTVTFGGLMAALANRFQDMGAEDTTEMITLPNAEYFIRDRRWGLGMHTFNFVGQIDAKDLYDRFCQRVVFLKRKLLQDLAEARKIFVFYPPGLEAGDLRMLHGAIKALGPVTLLYVTTLDFAPTAPHAALAGSVRQIEPGLFVGDLSRGGRDPLGTGISPSMIGCTSAVGPERPWINDSQLWPVRRRLKISMLKKLKKWRSKRRMSPSRPVVPSRLTMPFDTYKSRAPAAQNCIDAVPGWNSRFPDEYGLVAGNIIDFNDGRIVWAIERFGDLSGANVLEIGPMEGAHPHCSNGAVRA